MTRRQVITALQIAGYHSDMKNFTRLYVENRVSISNARKAYAEGQIAKQNGIGCNCYECKDEEVRN